MKKNLFYGILGALMIHSCGIKGKPLPPLKPEEMKTTEPVPTQSQPQKKPSK